MWICSSRKENFSLFLLYNDLEVGVSQNMEQMNSFLNWRSKLLSIIIVNLYMFTKVYSEFFQTFEMEFFLQK